MAQKNAASDVVGTLAHMKKSGTLKILIIALVLGAALFVTGSIFFSDKEKDNAATGDDSAEGELIGFFEYKKFLENEIETLCMGVGGVRKVSAVVFFDDVGGSVYAQNTQSGGAAAQKQEYVIIGSGSGSHALYLGESLPTLSGIGIVCDTEGDEYVKNEIAALLSSAYGLPLTRIYVSGS